MRKTLDKLKTEAITSTKVFFDSCIPEELKPKFKSVALKIAPDDFDEVQRLKLLIESSYQDDQLKVQGFIPEYSHICARYQTLSKKLIRRVSFELLRASPKLK